jgi:hypothetical protein
MLNLSPAQRENTVACCEQKKSHAYTTSGAILQHTVPLPPVSTESTTTFDIFAVLRVECVHSRMVH